MYSCACENIRYDLKYLFPWITVQTGTSPVFGCQCPLCFPLDKEREEKTLNAIGNARKKITSEIHELSERLKTNREAIQKLKEQIEELEENG